MFSTKSVQESEFPPRARRAPQIGDLRMRAIPVAFPSRARRAPLSCAAAVFAVFLSVLLSLPAPSVLSAADAFASANGASAPGGATASASPAPESAYRVRVNVSYPGSAPASAAAAQDSAAPDVSAERIASTEIIEPFGSADPAGAVVSEPQKILAVLGGEPITEEDVLGELWASRGRETFDWLVGRAILRRELRRLDLEIGEREVSERLELHLANLRRAFPGLAEPDDLTRASGGLGLEEYRERTVWTEIALRKIMRAKSRPPEEKLRQFYAEIRAEFIRPERVRVSQVFIPPQPSPDADGIAGAGDWARAERQILEADSRLRMRENFADVARAYGTGGQLSRWVERGELLRELETAAFSILPGAITTPIRTAMGYHKERREPSFEEVRSAVVERYREGEFLATAGDFLSTLRAEALRTGALDLSGAENAFGDAPGEE